MDIGSRFSAGTLRVIDVALRMAPDPEAMAGEHLLWALWNDESRAADLLARAGTTEEILVAALGSPAAIAPAADDSPPPSRERSSSGPSPMKPIARRSRNRPAARS